jgi:hypothetical protein
LQFQLQFPQEKGKLKSLPQVKPGGLHNRLADLAAGQAHQLLQSLNLVWGFDGAVTPQQDWLALDKKRTFLFLIFWTAMGSYSERGPIVQD